MVNPMNDTLTKHAHTGLLGEAAALRWLAEAESSGGLRVAHVISATDTELIEERIATSNPMRTMARTAGAALARTHAAGALSWGVAPDGWQGDYIIGHSYTPTVGHVKVPEISVSPLETIASLETMRSSEITETPVTLETTDAAETTAMPPQSWGAFWSRYRIGAYLKQLPPGFFSEAELALFGQLCQSLEAGELDAPQPALVREQGHEVARVHGDLWAGNLLWSSESPTGAVLIDPMAHGGHAEEDLAMLTLFGCSYLDEFIEGYESVSPLAAGWRSRVSLMQLAPLLHHCVLFGQSYKNQTLVALRKYVPR